jgi:hypothetical protein
MAGYILKFFTGANGADTSTTEKMRIDSSGRVGIGVAAPDTEFHVVGLGTVAKFEATDGAAYINLKDDDGTQGFMGLDAGSFVFQTSGSSYSNKLVITSAGNVGIGDTDPSEAKLSIDNVASGDAGLKIKQAQAQNGLLIDQNGNSHAIYIDSAASTGDGIRVEASSLTTSSAAHVYSGGANTSTRNLVHIHNDHASATGTTALYVKQDSTGLAADFIGAGGIRSASGIKFGTDTAAANALDDYEEGNFTTTFIVGGNAITASYTSQHVASYIKVGKMVTCFIQTNTSSISGTISGNVELTGLPFTKGGNGGKGVVILSMPDADYSGTTTGSPTVATGVSGKTVLTFTGTGSYTT